MQVAWNPARARAWRLLGYENRVMRNQDFTDDAKDGGELGAGHRVTALYEVEPAGEVDREATLLTLRLRWKEPDAETSAGIEVAAQDDGRGFEDASGDLKFLASVAAGGMILRGSTHKGDATLARCLRWAAEGQGRDASGERGEWLDLLRKAARILNVPEAEPTTPVGARPGAAAGRG